jgi:glycosyltransferase involved in cell wall biosynthesis
MKILFCNYEYPPLGGGGGVVNAQLAEELAGRHEVTVLTSQALDLPDIETVNGVEIRRVPVWGRKEAAAASMVSMLSYVPVGARYGRSMLKERPFDVINTHFVVPTGPLGAYLAGRAGIPNVLTVHGGDLYDPSKKSSPHRHLPLRIIIRSLLKRANVVVGQSQNTVDNIHSYYVDDLDCELIPLGIVRPGQPDQSRQGLGFAENDKILVTVGRLVARKAVSQLLELVAELPDPNVRLVVIGDGPLRPELENQAQHLGIAERVRFAGFVEEQEKANLLNAADLYVSTSQHEGFGLVFLEAMAAGLPVVCYDFGGQSDFLEHGETGALVSLNDRDAFRRNCEQLLSAVEQRAKIAETNRVRVESFYIDTCARRYEQLFEKVVAESSN